MARRKKQHLMSADLDVAVGIAACGRYIGRRRLIAPASPSRWRSVVDLGLGCQDCQRSALAATLKV